MMNETALDNALRKKFTSTRHVLRTLGFDSKDIDEVLEDSSMRTTHPRRPGDTRARDDNPVVDAESALALIEQVVEDLPEAEADELCDQLEERLLRDEPGASDRRRRKRAEDARMGRRSRGRLGKDEPEPFPGRPNHGGWQDPLDARAQDRVASRRHLTHGMDSAGDSFDRLFPDAKRINITSGTGRLTPVL
jgi:hypothetical protein